MSTSQNETLWDAFISHATEDKGFARPLARALSALGARVWFDEFSLKLGDNLGEEIDRGLAKSRFGIVILSPSFFRKRWPQRELEGLVAREVRGRSVILPLWHKVTFDDVCDFSPTLANKVAANTENRSAEQLAIQILSVIRPDIAGGVSYRDLHNAAQGEGLNELREELGQKSKKRAVNPHFAHSEREFESIEIKAPIGCKVADIILVEDGKIAVATFSDARYFLGTVEKIKLSLGAGIPQNYRSLHFYNTKDGSLISKSGDFELGISAASKSPDGSHIGLIQTSGVCSSITIKSFNIENLGGRGSIVSYGKAEVKWRSDSRACLFHSKDKSLYYEIGRSTIAVDASSRPHECPARNSWLFIDRDAIRETDHSFSKKAREIFVLDNIDASDREAQMAISPSGELSAVAQIYTEGKKSFARISVYQTESWRSVGHLNLEVRGYQQVLEWISEDYLAVQTVGGFNIHVVPELHLTHSLRLYGDCKVLRTFTGDVWVASKGSTDFRLLNIGKLSSLV